MVLFFIVFILFYLFCILPTQWLKIERIQHNLNLQIKIIQLSDLHLEKNRIPAKRIRNVIKKEKPNYIVMTGDFLDTPEMLSKIDSYLRSIEAGQIPIYAVLGNHDYRLGTNLSKLKKVMKDNGIHLLCNESIDMGLFILIGVDDSTTHHENVEQAYSAISQSEKKKIIITHNADVSSQVTQKFDYLMSGHLHGKQFELPFLFHLRPMGYWASVGIYKGLHHTKDGTIYISKGIGQSRINCRFLVRSEITIHEL